MQMVAAQVSTVSPSVGNSTATDDAAGGAAAASGTVFGDLLSERLGLNMSLALQQGVTDIKLGLPNEKASLDTQVLEGDLQKLGGDLQQLADQLQMLMSGQSPDSNLASVQPLMPAQPQSFVRAASVTEDEISSSIGGMGLQLRQEIATTAPVLATVNVDVTASQNENAVGASDFSAMLLKGAVSEKVQIAAAVEVVAARREATLAELPQVIPTASNDAPSSLTTFPQVMSAQQSTLAPPVAPLPKVEIQAPVTSSAWGSGLGDKVVWMVSQQHQGVELHLNPPALGPLEVRVSMSDGQANLSFMTQHVPVREAIESATSRLREMLGESGISMGSVSVNVGSFSQQQPQANSEGERSNSSLWRFGHEAGLSSDAPVIAVRSLHGNGMVDTFA